MKITRVSPFSNKKTTLEIAVTARQIASWEKGELIQDAMPNLTPAEREFIKMGITPDEWDDIFGVDK
ncbi:MAG: hypothetical protein HOJ68_01400 [Bacteroidetes bacterium]|jgi:hypothetical protein|nr:hypothetical protein [Bacteroidota bacterium]